MRKFLCGILAAALLLTLIPLGTASTALAATDYSNVRVLLSVGSVKTLTIPVSGSYFIEENGASFKNGTLTVQVSGSKLVVSHSTAGELFRGASVQIMRESISPSAGYLRLTTSGVTRTFLGHLTLKYSGGYIRVINTVPLPHYLYGVVAYEMSDTFPLEALKAQAVAAKCYALSGMTGGSDYDIGDTSADQVYKGYNSSYRNVINAVDATYNVGLYLGGSILRSYFAASNGGRTILPSDAWSGSNRYVWDKAYARVDDPYDVANPSSAQESIALPKNGENSRISAALSNYLRGRAAKVLLEAGYMDASSTVVGIDSIDSLTQTSDTTADIAMTAIVQLADGTQQSVSFNYSFNLNEFVWNGVMTLATDLRMYTVAETNKSYTVTRGRYGHGVGLSQRGAQQMATSGWGYERILKFYYPGASIKPMGIAAPADPEKPATNPADNIGTPIGIAITIKNAKFRAEASSSSTLLGTIPQGTSLPIYAQENDFSLTVINGTAGYVSNSSLSAVDDGQTDPGSDPGTDSGTKTVTAYGEVSSSTLNLREQPATSGKILKRLVKGDKIDIYGYVQDSNWYFCSYKGTDGYVSAQYINVTGTPNTDPGTDTGTDPGTDTGTDVTGGATGVITDTGVSLRSNPSTSRGTILAKLDLNTQVSILSEVGNYYAVVVNSQQGYVSKTYVRVTSTGSSSNGSDNSGTDNSGTASQGTGVTAGSVNLRSGAGTSYSILARFAKDTQLTLYSLSNGWYKVGANGKTGYISADYVKKTEGNSNSGSGTSTDGKTWAGVVVNEWVRMRSTPDLSSQNNIVGTYAVGTPITILAQSGSFYLVSVDGVQGYMHKDYVQVTGENASTQRGVTTASVYLRGGPGSSYKVITTLSKGMSITILSSSGDYYQAQAGSYTGYLVKKYVSVQ